MASGTCTLITAILLVLLTTVAAIVAFTTPHWLNYRLIGKSEGLWLSCGTTDWGNCEWYFSPGFSSDTKSAVWFKAVQGLFTCAVVSSLLSLMIALFSLCCSCECCNPHQAAGAFANLTFLLLAVAMCVFGAKAHLDNQAEINPDSLVSFGWSFWLGVGATVLSLVSKVLYSCVSRSEDVVVYIQLIDQEGWWTHQTYVRC